MPNWCQNTLNVSGDEKSIASFIARARGRHAGYNDIRYDIDTREWPAYDEVRVKALTKDPAPHYGEEREFCLNALYPVPEDYRRFPFDDSSARKIGELVGESRECGGYSWQADNWGTKWDVDAEVLHQEDCFVQYRFDSAWSPPISFLEKVCKDFPSLSFELEYYEPGMGYAGKAYFDNGEFSGEDEVDVEDYESEWEDEE